MGASGQSLDGTGGPNKKRGEGGSRRALCGPSPPCPAPRKPQEGWLGGRRLPFYYKRQTTASLFLGTLPALSGGRGPARENRAERVQVLRSGPASKHTPVSCHTPHSSSNFLFPPELTLHREEKKRDCGL